MNKEKLVLECENDLSQEFKKIDEIEFYNSKKVLDAFHKESVVESDFNETTGYGYNDFGRDKIERIFARIFKAEKAVVRGQFISASHALCVTFFALLRPNDTLLSITGKPYDTLDEVIGLKENNSSLKSFGISYEQIDLVDNDFDYERISSFLKENKVKVIEIQRSKGYSTRKSIGIDKVEKVIKLIKEIDKNIIVMVDNCYCEFVSYKVMYLTFDCGYENGYTEQILDTLKKHNAKACFFVTQTYIRDNVELVKRMKEEGHQVGNHTVTHPSMPGISVEKQKEELQTCADYMKEATGYRMDPYFRPPSGEYSERVLQLAKDMGYKTIFWSMAYLDYDVNNQPGKDYVIEHFDKYYHNGAIPLMHNVSESNAQALDTMLSNLTELGYRFVSLDEMFEK